MKFDKQLSRFLAKSLLIPAVVSCFSCNFVFSMEDYMNGVEDQDKVLNNIRIATQAVVDSIISDLKSYISIVISNSGSTRNVIIKGKSEYIRKFMNDHIPNIDKKFKSCVKAALGKDKFENYELSLARLNRSDALDLLKDFALEYFDLKTETMLTELGV